MRARDLLTGIVAIALAGLAQEAWNRGRPAETEEAAASSASGEELPLFPSGRALSMLGLGQPTLLADLAWLQAIQYYGKHRLGDREYPLAGHLFDVTVRCDPSFRMAYIFGGLVLEEATGTLAPGRDLLRRGQIALPEDWSLPFHAGFLEYLHGDPAAGAREMERSTRRPGAPAYAARLATHAYARAGDPDRAARIWELIERESEDASMRALARERLLELRAPARESEPRRRHP